GLTPAKDDIAAAIRSADGARSVTDGLDVDPVKDAAAAAKANADRRTALAALGLLQPSKQQNLTMQPGNTAQAAAPGRTGRESGGSIGDASPADALKETVRPVYDEISKSGIADAVRSLKADLKAELADEKDKAAAGAAAPATPAPK